MWHVCEGSRLRRAGIESSQHLGGTTSNSSSDDPDATGRARSPECAVMAGPLSHAWKDSSLSQCVTTK